jgi:hypothetical protein
MAEDLALQKDDTYFLQLQLRLLQWFHSKNLCRKCYYVCVLYKYIFKYILVLSSENARRFPWNCIMKYSRTKQAKKITALHMTFKFHFIKGRLAYLHYT